MAKAKPIKNCKNGREVIKSATKQGANVRHGARHDVVYNDYGQCAVPRHNGDLPKGTHSAITKTLAAMGIVILLAFCGWSGAASWIFSELVANL